MRNIFHGIAWNFILLLPINVLAVDKTECNQAKDYLNRAINIKNIGTKSLFQKEQLYRQAITICPTYAEAHNNLGDIYERQGRIELAIRAYKKSVELEPDFAFPHFGLGDIYFKTQQTKKAERWYLSGLKLDPTDKIANKNLSLIKDIKKSGIIKADTIRSILSTHRGIGEEVSLTMGNTLPFDLNKFNIRTDAKPQLNELGKALKDILKTHKKTKEL